jgi:hypothetical protein
MGAVIGGTALALSAAAMVGVSAASEDPASNASAADVGTVTCPDVASQLPDVPAQAKAEVDRNLTLLQTQISEAQKRLESTVGQGGQNFVQNAILGPLADKRASTISRIEIAIGRVADVPQLPVMELSTCSVEQGDASASASDAAAADDTASADATDSASADATDSASADVTDSASADATDSASADATDSASADATDSASADATDSASADATDSASADVTDSASADATDSASADATDTAAADENGVDCQDVSQKITVIVIEVPAVKHAMASMNKHTKANSKAVKHAKTKAAKSKAMNKLLDQRIADVVSIALAVEKASADPNWNIPAVADCSATA